MNKFKAYRILKAGTGEDGGVTELSLGDLSQGEVVIDAEYSGLNYKDALAVTGKGKILRKFPINAGIDVAGVVRESAASDIKVGTKVLVTGCGFGEKHDGGYSQVVRVPKEWVVPIPDTLSTKEAMIYGTAGFTAGLCIYRLQQNNQQPSKGPIVVTGASGGVGMFAVSMLASSGFSVLAVTGKPEQADRLKALGANEVLPPDELGLGQRPLESVKFGGAVDNVGGEMLEGLIRHTNLWGNIACVGLAGGSDYSSSVMPMILRGVSLLGISSTNCERDLRDETWQRLGGELKPNDLESIVTETIGLDELLSASEKMLGRKTFGRFLVDLRK